MNRFIESVNPAEGYLNSGMFGGVDIVRPLFISRNVSDNIVTSVSLCTASERLLACDTSCVPISPQDIGIHSNELDLLLLNFVNRCRDVFCKEISSISIAFRIWIINYMYLCVITYPCIHPRPLFNRRHTWINVTYRMIMLSHINAQITDRLGQQNRPLGWDRWRYEVVQCWYTKTAWSKHCGEYVRQYNNWTSYST